MISIVLQIWTIMSTSLGVIAAQNMWASNRTLLMTQKRDGDQIDNSSRITYDVTTEYLLGTMNQSNSSFNFAFVPNTINLSINVNMIPPITQTNITASWQVADQVNRPVSVTDASGTSVINELMPADLNYSDVTTTALHSKFSFFFYLVHNKTTKALIQYFVCEGVKPGQSTPKLGRWQSKTNINSACLLGNPLVHFMESTQNSVVFFCTERVANSPNVLKLVFYECSSMNCLSDLFNSTIENPRKAQEIITANFGSWENSTTLRSLRLEVDPTILNDTVFWKAGTNQMFHMDEVAGDITNISLPGQIASVQMLRSQFLLVTVVFDDPKVPNIDRIKNFLFAYPLPGAMRLTRLMKMVKSCVSLTVPTDDCSMAIIPRKYLGFYYLSSEDENIFEFDSAQGTESSQLIDVYRFHHGLRKFEKIIESWPEKMDPNTTRFGAPPYFIQLKANTSLKVGRNDTRTKIDIYLAPRRYKAAFKHVESINTEFGMDLTGLFYFFDTNFRTLYLVYPTQTWVIPIEPAKLKFELFDRFQPVGTQSPTLPPPLPSWVTDDIRKSCQKYTLVQLQSGNKTLQHLVCLNVDLVPGTFVFNPSLSNSWKTSNILGSDKKVSGHGISEKVPTGLIKEIDFSQLIQGSFLKLVPSNSNNVSEITNNYLDSYVYKLQFKKAKFLESIYGFESYDGDERKITFAISTTYENYFYLANRFQRDLTQPAIAAKRVKSFSLRDYRVLTRFEPINSSAVLVQVEDLTYVVNINSNAESPDFPSKGANGVCANNTILRHNTMGKLMLCVYETKVYIRVLNSDFGIVQIATTADVENILRSIRHLRFLRSSAHFENFVFLWYHTKPDTTSSVDSKDDLNMAILMLDNVAKPTLSLVQLQKDFRRIRYQTELQPPLIQVQDVALAGDKLVTLEKIDGSNPETYFATYSFNYPFIPAFEYFVTLPTDQIMMLPSSQLYVTNVMSEVESQDFLNTVVSYQKNLYQVVTKVQMIRTKQMKALVFNPFAQPYDSLSFVELPPGYLIVDIGSTTHQTKKREYLSLCILGANSTKLDDEFFSQEPPVYIFLVNDLTPTLTLKPIKSPQILIESTDRLELKSLNFSFNMTSSIYTPMFLEENKHKTKPMAFDLVPKLYVMEGSSWGRSFAARGTATVDPNTQTPRTSSDMLLDSTGYTSPRDLDNFFFRLDPALYVKGTVLSFGGLPESSVEAYMGIVKVLPHHNTSNIRKGSNTRLRPIEDIEPGRYFMNWDCNRSLISQESHNHQNPSRLVWACRSDQNSISTTDFISRIVPIVSFNSRIYRVHPTSNVSDFSYHFPKTATSYTVSNGQLFYFMTGQPGGTLQTNKTIYLCVDPIVDTLSELAASKPKPCQVFKEAKDFNAGDQLELLAFKTSSGSIVAIREYNPFLMIYTQIAYYSIPQQLKASTQIQKLGSSEFISSDQLATVMITKNSNSLMFNIYYRWRNENDLTLIIKCNNLTNSVPADIKLAIPLLSFEESLDSLYSISHDIGVLTPRLMHPGETYVVPSNKSEECLPIILSFNRANSYLIYLPIWLVEAQVASNAKQDPLLGGVKINLSEVYIAPISNPFFGFTPDSDSPEPQFYSDYFFKAVNFKERSYLLSYHLKTQNLKKFPDIQNILGLKANQKNADTLDMDSIYESQAEYIYTTSVTPLRERPIAMMVMPNVFPKNDLEHQMIYVSQQHELFEMNFTSYMNVRVRTFRLASRMMTLNVSGVLNQNISVQLNFKGFANSGFLDDVSVTARLIVLTVIALAVTTVLLFVIEKDVKSTQGENHRVLLRHSIKPITSAIGNFASVMVPLEDQQQEQKLKFEESDDSDEAAEICASLIKRETAYISQNKSIQNKVTTNEGRSQTELAAPRDAENDLLASVLHSDAIRSRRSMRPGA